MAVFLHTLGLILTGCDEKFDGVLTVDADIDSDGHTIRFGATQRVNH